MSKQVSIQLEIEKGHNENHIYCILILGLNIFAQS